MNITANSAEERELAKFSTYVEPIRENDGSSTHQVIMKMRS